MKKLKITAIISGTLTFLQALPSLISAVLSWFSLLPNIRVASSIGVIGGADGPTSIFVATLFPTYIVVARQVFFIACMLTFVVSMVLIAIKSRKKNNG